MEIVYILINEAMQGYVKIGRTSDLEQRIRSLDSTGVPLPFECFYACTVTDAQFVEKQLHDAFADARVRSNREWFEIAAERVAAALRIAEIDNVTPTVDYVEDEEAKKALNKARSKRENFNFKMVDIPVGATLTFTRDESIVCQVIDAKRVQYKNELTSLSAAAQDALQYPRSVQGALYWEYKGETLVERRLRMEQG